MAFLHPASEEEAALWLGRYGLGDLPRVADPQGVAYEALGLGRMGVVDALAPKVLLRGAGALLAGHGAGVPSADPMLMPGVFRLVDGRVDRAFRHRTPADRPDYLALARPEEPTSA